MAKKRKRGRAASDRPSNAAARRPDGVELPPVLPRWRWRTFPVFFALVSGAMLAFLVSPPDYIFGQVAQYAAVAGFGYGLAHLFVTNIILAGRLKRRRMAAQRGEPLPEDFEEELVYSGEDAPDSRK